MSCFVLCIVVWCGLSVLLIVVMCRISMICLCGWLLGWLVSFFCFLSADWRSSVYFLWPGVFLLHFWVFGSGFFHATCDIFGCLTYFRVFLRALWIGLCLSTLCGGLIVLEFSCICCVRVVLFALAGR